MKKTAKKTLICPSYLLYVPKGRTNKLVNFVLRFAIDLVDLIEQNCRHNSGIRLPLTIFLLASVIFSLPNSAASGNEHN